ncbi:MAG: Uma2 family endonuclease, partial [Planctomycetales bacterium]|nr:Uma2 family endonuclease [Planctomycetales bacterium]
MSTAQRLTADEYDEMVAQGVFEPAERRIELIRGRLREMSPAGPVHDELVNWLTDWSYSIVGDAPIRIRTQSGLRLNQQESRPEPDIF